MSENSSSYSFYDLFDVNKSKLIWKGSLSQLKTFVGTQVNQASANKATWRSPSGGTWCFKGDNDLSVTWHSKSKTIVFDGKAANEIKNRIHEAIYSRCNASSPSELNTSNLLTNDQNLLITEEDKRGCGDCYKLSIEMAEVKLELAMLSALMDKPELNKKDLRKNSVSTTTLMKCASTQTTDYSADGMADPIQPKPCSSAPFYHQLNSYRLASKIEFNEFKKASSCDKPSCIKITPNNTDENAEIKSLKQRIEASQDEIKSLRTIISLMDEKAPNNKGVVKQHRWQINKSRSKTKGKNPEKGKRNSTSDSTKTKSDNLPTTNQFSPLVDQIDLTNDQQPDYHDETSGAKNDTNKPVSEKPKNRKIQTEEHRQQKKSKYTAVLGDSLLRGIRRDKISRSTKQRVRIGCFPGATIEDMKYYIKPTLKRKPDHVILHIGTNNSLANSAEEVTAGIATLCDEITQDQPDAHITISELITRDDKQNAKVKICEINEALKQYCEQNSKVSLLSHYNINDKALNGSKLHLNEAGTKVFAKNIINCINRF